MEKKKRINWFLLLRLIGIIAFIVVLTQVDFAELWQYIKGIDSQFLLLAILFQVILLIIKALRWHILNIGTENQKTFLVSSGEFLESYAVGMITPGRLGELMKAGHAKSKTGIILTGIRVVIERGIDIGFFLIISGSALLWTELVDWNPIWGIIVLASGIGVSLLSMALMSSRKAWALIDKLASWFKKKETNLSEEFQLRSVTTNLNVVVLSLGSNFSSFISCYMLALGISFGLSFLYVSGGVAIAGMLNLLPITVMGLGTRELTFLYVFNEFPKSQILAFSSLWFLVAQIGGGLIAMAMGQLFLFISKRGNDE